MKIDEQFVAAMYSYDLWSCVHVKSCEMGKRFVNHLQFQPPATSPEPESLEKVF